MSPRPTVAMWLIATRDESGLELTIGSARSAGVRPGFAASSSQMKPATSGSSSANGADSAMVSGSGGGPTLRILADQGDDVMVDSAASGSNRFYDDPAASGAHSGRKRGDRSQAVRPAGPARRVSFRPETGVTARQWLVMGSPTALTWASSSGPVSPTPATASASFLLPERQRIRAGFATGPGSYRFDYRGEFHRENSRAGFLLLARASGIDVLNFHGFGNEIDDPGSAEFYRVTQDAYTVSPLFLFPLTQHGNIAFGPYLKYASTDNRTRSFPRHGQSIWLGEFW